MSASQKTDANSEVSGTRPHSSAPASSSGGGGRAIQLKAALRGHDFATQVQMLSPDHGTAATSRPDVHAAAAEGVRSGGGRLPHGEKIQRSFGGYDISNVIAHTGAAAEHASAAMGASAYATGNDVVLGKGGTDLHTVAHEAAHVVQQRAGVSLSGGVGQAGDPYERHADAVADLVVQGKSAEGLLGEMSGGGGGGVGVQMRESEPSGAGLMSRADGMSHQDEMCQDDASTSQDAHGQEPENVGPPMTKGTESLIDERLRTITESRRGELEGVRASLKEKDAPADPTLLDWFVSLAITACTGALGNLVKEYLSAAGASSADWKAVAGTVGDVTKKALNGPSGGANREGPTGHSESGDGPRPVYATQADAFISGLQREIGRRSEETVIALDMDRLSRSESEALRALEKLQAVAAAAPNLQHLHALNAWIRFINASHDDSSAHVPRHDAPCGPVRREEGLLTLSMPPHFYQDCTMEEAAIAITGVGPAIRKTLATYRQLKDIDIPQLIKGDMHMSCEDDVIRPDHLFGSFTIKHDRGQIVSLAHDHHGASWLERYGKGLDEGGTGEVAVPALVRRGAEKLVQLALQRSPQGLK